MLLQSHTEGRFWLLPLARRSLTDLTGLGLNRAGAERVLDPWGATERPLCQSAGSAGSVNPRQRGRSHQEIMTFQRESRLLRSFSPKGSKFKGRTRTPALLPRFTLSLLTEQSGAGEARGRKKRKKKKERGFMGQPIGVSGRVLRKEPRCCLFSFSCVRPSGLRSLRASLGPAVSLPPTPPSSPATRSLKKKKQNKIWWADSGTCSQDPGHRNIHTDMWPQQSREAEVRGFPV